MEQIRRQLRAFKKNTNESAVPVEIVPSRYWLGAAVILLLHSRLPPKFVPYNLYFDNIFTSLRPRICYWSVVMTIVLSLWFQTVTL
jgi:hypothetical protein